MSNKVTVVIPCYNDGVYIQEAVASILEQTFSDFRIIIIDDGSNDETKFILKAIKHEKITVYFQDNQGVSQARNYGIGLTDSEYILTLDADDYFEPTFLEKAVHVLNTNKTIAIVGCYYNVIQSKACKSLIKPLGGGIENFLIKNEGLGNALFRKKCWEEVGGYDINMQKGYEDWEFWIAVLSKGWKMQIIEESLFNYRMKPDSRDKQARTLYDLELKKYILDKHQDTYKLYFKRVISTLLEQNARQQTKQHTLKHSKNYRLGVAILYPFRYIKRLITRK